MKKEIEELIVDLTLKGLIYEKIVRKATLTSGAFFIPKRFIGQKFRILMIPIEEKDVLETDISKLKEIKEQLKN